MIKWNEGKSSVLTITEIVELINMWLYPQRIKLNLCVFLVTYFHSQVMKKLGKIYVVYFVVYMVTQLVIILHRYNIDFAKNELAGVGELAKKFNQRLVIFD